MINATRRQSLLRDAVTRICLLHVNLDFSSELENLDSRFTGAFINEHTHSGGDALRGHTRSHPEHDG